MGYIRQSLGVRLFLLYMLWRLGGLGEATAAPVRADCLAGLPDYRVALQAYEDGLIDPAIAGFVAFLQKCPQAEAAPQAHYLLGEIFFKRQRFAEAYTHAMQVLSQPEATALHPHAAMVAGQSLLQRGQTEAAQAVLQRALLASAPVAVRSVALSWLGDLAFQQQHYLEAQTYYQQILQEQPAGPHAAYAQYALGWVWRQLHKLPEAIAAFSAFLTLDPEHEFAIQARFTRAVLWRETGQLPEALAALQELAPIAPATLQEEVLFWWAETAYQLQLYDEAQTIYQRVVTAYPQGARAHASLYGWGWAAVQQQCQGALQPWEQLLQRDAQWPQALAMHYQLGLCYVSLAQYAPAQAHLQQVLAAGEATDYYLESVLQLAALAFQQGDYAAAVPYYTQALTVVHSDEAFRLRYLLAESYAALGQLTQAMTQWQHVLSGSPDLPFRALTLYRLGSAYVQQQDWRVAIPLLRQVWNDFPDFTERLAVARLLIQAWVTLGQCAEAVPFYDTLLQGTPEVSQQQAIRIAKALCVFEQGHYPEVVRLLEPLLTPAWLATVSPEVLYTLGQAYRQLQQYPAALMVFTSLYERFPTAPLTIAAMPAFAVALEQAGQQHAALTIWQAYLEGNTALPADERLRLQLHVGRLAVQIGRLAVALVAMESVRGSASPSLAAEAWFWSGEVYFQQQQWELALQAYQEVLDTQQAVKQWRTIAQLRMGTIYEQQHEWERALQTYQYLLSTATDDDVLSTVQQRIAAIEAGRSFQPLIPEPSPSEG